MVLVHPKLGDMGYLGMAAARSCGGAVCLLLMVLLIKRARLQHLVWSLPPSPPSSPSLPSPPAGTGTGTSTSTSDGAGTGAGTSTGAAARVLSGVELRRFVTLALPSACVMWIEWW